MKQRGAICILGAGPTGLGAARQLQTLGVDDWTLYEREETVGGLARSFRDAEGCTWDIGGHVVFSHYGVFTRLLTDLLGSEGWLEHERACWVRLGASWVPYPFQQNLRHLPPALCAECLSGLMTAALQAEARPCANFDDFILRTCGEGIANIFMRPYNRKVWAYDPREMAAGWVGERVAVPDPVRVARNIVLGQDDVAWGPNNRFRFPRTDGTGHIWTALAARLPAEKMRRGCAAVAVDVARKRLHLADGTTREYAALISTIPLTELASMSDNEELMALAEPLQHSATHVIGVGLRGQPPADVRDKCWIYFPEEHAPFYRVTHFSHYSPHNVDDIRTRWSLLAEVSESAHKPVNPTTLANDVIRGLCATGMIDNRQQVTHTWTHRVEYGYPTPSLGRDAALQRLLPRLAACDILSRGRFGAWLYEVGNMDHSFMQGVEAVNHLLLGTPELTLWYPNQINTPHPVLQFERYREPVGDQVGRLAA